MIMRVIDEHSETHPAENVNSMEFIRLQQKGCRFNPMQIRRLFAITEHHTTHPKLSMSNLGEPQYIHLYQPRNMTITSANRVLSVYITCIPMVGWFMFFFAELDIYIRKFMNKGIPNSFETKWSLEVLVDMVRIHGKTYMVNSDQESQFNSAQWRNTLEDLDIKFHRDGKKAFDNPRMKRFWRTIKQKHIYLNPFRIELVLYEEAQENIQKHNEEKAFHTFKKVPQKRYFQSRNVNKSIHCRLLTKTETFHVRIK